ncbi:hypothetical protein J6590_000172 [Homalodisca vitripennis]|nr:hypothetical protein J6590_000172 [Homalodisca vitripennis]
MRTSDDAVEVSKCSGKWGTSRRGRKSQCPMHDFLCRNAAVVANVGTIDLALYEALAYEDVQNTAKKGDQPFP